MDFFEKVTLFSNKVTYKPLFKDSEWLTDLVLILVRSRNITFTEKISKEKIIRFQMWIKTNLIKNLYFFPKILVLSQK